MAQLTLYLKEESGPFEAGLYCAYIAATHVQVDEKVLIILLSTNDQSTGFSPFCILLGHQARLPVGLAYGTAPMEEMTTQEYVRNLWQTVEKAYSTVRNHTGALEGQKELYDRR